jgi:hypothetical protein
MSLKDFLALTDSTLEKDFSTPAFDVNAAREKVLKIIDKANEQFGSEPTRGPKRWKVNRNVVEFSLPVEIEGTSTFYIPSERFPDALKKIRAAVAAGEADSMLDNMKGEETTRAKVGKIMGERRQRAGWTDERRERQRASIEARRFAKDKAVK